MKCQKTKALFLPNLLQIFPDKLKKEQSDDNNFMVPSMSKHQPKHSAMPDVKRNNAVSGFRSPQTQRSTAYSNNSPFIDTNSKICKD